MSRRSFRRAGLALAACAALGSTTPLGAQDIPGPGQTSSGGTSSSETGSSKAASSRTGQRGFDATFDAEPEPTITSQMSADEFIAFFTLFSENDEMAQAFRTATEPMLEKGKRIENWREQGIDILGHLAAREGGLKGNLLRDLDREVLSVIDLSGQLRPELEGFDSYALRPEPVGLVAERTFIGFLPGIWFELAVQRNRQGNALCYGGYFGVTLHTRTDYRRWSEDQLIGIASFFAIADQLASLEVCSIYSLDEEGHYVTRTVLPDGTDLPAMNGQADASVVMPAAQIEDFLRTIPRRDIED